MIALRTHRLFDGEAFAVDRTVLLDGPTIAAVVEARMVPSGTRVMDLPPGITLAPGYIDLQVNGGGRMLNDAPDRETLAHIAAAHASVGTTSILPTLISGPRHQREAALSALAAGAIPGIAGLHIEGPFLAPARRGIHPAAAMAMPTEADLDRLCTARDFPLLLTLAPEIVSLAQIARLAAAGVIVFAGHTDAAYEPVNAALAAGVTGFTHLFNAMSQITGRGPGAVGAAFDHATAHAGIIVDGHHVHPANIRIAFNALGPHRLFLVSDAMATSASESKGFTFNAEAIHLVGGRLTNAAGTLAGAHLTIAEAVRHAVARVGISPANALRMATATPADVLRRPDLGRLAPGCVADLIALDENLFVQGVCRAGDVAGLVTGPPG